MKRSPRNLLIILFVTIATIVAAWMLWPVGRAFDRVVWLDHTQETARLEMADRIVYRGMLKGKPRSEVVAMLGEPPKTGYFANWDLVYRLGRERGYFGIDSEWLVVRLDGQERVSEYRIVTD